ncbi:3,4-dihydroxy-2-butanone-4-phosphate synthase [Methanofollis fontis]|uniref:3,4-dihydroxy-2-butanone 4-phosphate synthase n=1 Tax=Methanofollis fontis TaxID=2052832 RepID=A0A483CQI4_9EURY|nr:3,4-dihydroxy-2-butanone-4-phosphate synthase [Methanofollis fontis]TAJ45373.1 3,4-dihydroxy-2-butanone-4-phosphate synthase [Methanofollis fontis]
MFEDACAALRDGKFVLLYDFDDREQETDLIIRADAVTPQDVLRMRRDGGGLICTAVHPLAAERLGLPFASDLMQNVAAAEQPGDIPYDRRNHSSFSIWVNHRSTFTGIPDRDRAVTINAIADQVKRSLNGGGHNFAAEFRTPGHVALLRAADGLLDVRRGQTELSIALAELAGTTPAVVVCEMLDDESGLALTKEDAVRYGAEHGIPFIGGSEVLEHWEHTKN